MKTKYAVWVVLVSHLLTGCRSRPEVLFEGNAGYRPIETQIEYPDACVQPVSAVLEEGPPHTLREPSSDDYWELTLEEVARIALANSKVMRELGARVLPAPASVTTVYDPALIQLDPRFGEQRALSEFDAQFATGIFFDKDDRAFNNLFIGGGASTLSRNSARFQAEISKTAATGTQFAVRNVTDYDRDTVPVPPKVFNSAYSTLFEAEFRHPLLQRAGIDFNRIAGPNGAAGNYRGIVIARLNTDIALADFEFAVREFLEDVQQTYWLLYFSYRNLDARIAARDAALESWRTAKTRLEKGAGDVLDESLTSEQFYQFQSEVENALSGIGTNTSISAAGPGIYATERQLRLLMGLPINDGRLIRPAEEPSRAETIFDWHESLEQAVDRRVELRRQRWTVKQREMELLAARNLTRAQLDLVGTYRWRGFGDDLLGNRNLENGSAARDLFTGDLQGWALGLQLSAPIGNRIGHTSVRHAQISLSKDQAILQEQERQVSKELSDAFSELDRAYRLTRTNFDRRNAARRRLQAERDKYDLGEGLLEFVFEAQSRVTDAETEFFRSLIDYNLAVAKIHYARGTFLDYLGVHLSEGAWSSRAHRSAGKEARRFRRRIIDYGFTLPCPISRGTFPQSVLPRDEITSLPATLDEAGRDAAEPAESPVPDDEPLDPLSPPIPDEFNLEIPTPPPGAAVN